MSKEKFTFVHKNFEIVEEKKTWEPKSLEDNLDTNTVTLKKKNLLIKGAALIFTLVLLVGIIGFSISLLSSKEEDDLVSVELDRSEASQDSSTQEPSPENLQNVILGVSKDFKNAALQNESTVDYKLHVKMAKENEFAANAIINITNNSTYDWGNLVFYFKPNLIVTEKSSRCIHPVTKRRLNKCPEGSLEGEADIQEVKLNGQAAEYKLDNDTLEISGFSPTIAPGKTVTVHVSYTFLLPNTGMPLVQEDHSNFYLAEWYPMLAVYNQSEWKKQPAFPGEETHFTAHSNFDVSYEIPPEYFPLSSDEADSYEMGSIGNMSGTNMKEMYIAFMKDPVIKEQKVNDTQIRVFSSVKNRDYINLVLSTAANSFDFFEKRIGKYPYKQLDIIINDQPSNAYPGVVTITPNKFKPEIFKHEIIREMAQQWFYGVINNEVYSEGWLDEGLTEFSTALYYMVNDKKSDVESLSFANNYFTYNNSGTKYSNLPMSDYFNNYYKNFYYGQPALELWKLINPYGGADSALEFLSKYYQTYAYSIVTTDEFLRFTTEYFKVDKKRFQFWLKYREE